MVHFQYFVFFFIVSQFVWLLKSALYTFSAPCITYSIDGRFKKYTAADLVTTCLF